MNGSQKKKVMLILPGVTGCSGANYVKDIVLEAHRSGYQAVVINSLVTKDDDATGDYRVLDFSDNEIIRSSIDLVLERLGKDVEVYGIGFSLGANHLLRYLGSHHHDSGITAAVSVSNPFDVIATTIKLKYRFFGVYDKVIRVKLRDAFLM